MQFCSERTANPIKPSPALLVDYLDSLYQKGLGYSSLNTARSAVSSLTAIDNINKTIGEHPLVTRFMRGVFSNRPSLPRYSNSWDVSIVLKYLKTLIPVNRLSLKHLTWKLVMLLSLLTGQRGQTLHLMDIRFIEITENYVRIQILELLKTSKPGKHLSPIYLEKYDSDESLCIVRTMKHYLERTSLIRGEETRLFITTIKPFRSISRQTLSSWIQKILSLSGIDISKFAPHSTRSAAVTSAFKCGVPLDVILKTANWSNSQTFFKYYNKPSDKVESFKNILDKKD